MKAWISIAVVVGIFMVGGLGMAIFRSLSADSGSGMQLSGELAHQGLRVATAQGCVACHSLDGARGIGPSWLGMWGSTRKLTDGRTVVVDEAYVRESILEPAAKVVEGYNNVMIRYDLSAEDMAAVVEFTRQLGTQH